MNIFVKKKRLNKKLYNMKKKLGGCNLKLC